MLHTIARSSKSLETFLQGKMCREGVKLELHGRIFRYWQDFHFEAVTLPKHISFVGPVSNTRDVLGQWQNTRRVMVRILEVDVPDRNRALFFR